MTKEEFASLQPGDKVLVIDHYIAGCFIVDEMYEMFGKECTVKGFASLIDENDAVTLKEGSGFGWVAETLTRVYDSSYPDVDMDNFDIDFIVSQYSNC